MIRIVSLFIAMALVSIPLSGCGSSGTLAPTQVLVVTIDGKPADGLNLTLIDDANRIAGSGSTGNDGKVAVRGANDRPLPAGTFKIIVTDLGEAEENPMVAQKPQKSRLPRALGNPASTPLKITIEAGKMEYPVEIKAGK